MATEYKLQQRRDSESDWESNNPTLASGQIGYSTDTGNIKIGNGSDPWNSLSFLLPPGILMPWASDQTAPGGWLKCDGSAVSRTTYAALHAVLKDVGGADNYGWGNGDGSTTFNLPDLQGAFLRGTGSYGSETMADGNAFAGPSVGSFEDDQMQGHMHNLFQNTTESGDTKPTVSDAAAIERIDGSNSRNYTILKGSGTAGIGKSSAPGTDSNGTPRTGDETRPFAAGVTYLIKT